MSRPAGDRGCRPQRNRCRRARGGFTLIELLVVIGIIVLLAGLLTPALMKARRKAMQSDCANSLHQFSVACSLYRMHHNDQWPAWLSTLYPTYIDDQTIYLCIADSRRGEIGGKPPELSDYNDHQRFDETDDTAGNPGPFVIARNTSVTACSYFYEMPAVECSWVQGAGIGYFPGAVVGDIDRNADGTMTWGEVKAYQLTHGDVYTGGEGYNEIYFPVIRCFHHHRDAKFYVDHTEGGGTGGTHDAEGLTLNVAWAGNIFQAPITWELTPQ